MRRTVELAERVAAGTRHMLLAGEPGSGRELIARTIHRKGTGRSTGFIKIGCDGRRTDELEMDIFGTRSDRDHSKDVAESGLEPVTPQSRLYQALGGSIFLEQLPEMPARLQDRLARVLRDGEFMV